MSKGKKLYSMQLNSTAMEMQHVTITLYESCKYTTEDIVEPSRSFTDTGFDTQCTGSFKMRKVPDVFLNYNDNSKLDTILEQNCHIKIYYW